MRVLLKPIPVQNQIPSHCYRKTVLFWRIISYNQSTYLAMNLQILFLFTQLSKTGSRLVIRTLEQRP